MGMTDLEKRAVWDVKDGWMVSVYEEGELVQRHFALTQPTWGIGSSTVTEQGTIVNFCIIQRIGLGIPDPGIESGMGFLHICGLSSLLNGELESGSFYREAEYDDITGITSFSRPVTVECVECFLFEAQIKKFGGRITLARTVYDDSSIVNPRTTGMTPIVVATDDLSGSDAIIIKRGREVDTMGANRITATVEQGFPAISMSGWEELVQKYNDEGTLLSHQYEHGGMLSFVHWELPLEGISLANIQQSAVYVTQGQERVIVKSPPIFTPKISGGSIIRLEQQSPAIPYPVEEDASIVGGVVEESIDDNERFWKWDVEDFDGELPSLDIPRFVIPEGFDFSKLTARHGGTLTANLFNAPTGVGVKIRTRTGEFESTELDDDEQVTLVVDGEWDNEKYQFMGWYGSVYGGELDYYYGNSVAQAHVFSIDNHYQGGGS